MTGLGYIYVPQLFADYRRMECTLRQFRVFKLNRVQQRNTAAHRQQ